MYPWPSSITWSMTSFLSHAAVCTLSSFPCFIQGPVGFTPLTYSQNHRGFEISRDPWRPPGPTSCSSRTTYGLPRTTSRWLLKISKEGTPQPLWATCASVQSPARYRRAFWCSHHQKMTQKRHRETLTGQVMLWPEANTGYIELLFKEAKRSQETTSVWGSENPVICAVKRDYSPSVPTTLQRNSELLILPLPAFLSPLLKPYAKPIYTIVYPTCLHHLPLHHCFSPCTVPGTVLGKQYIS